MRIITKLIVLSFLIQSWIPAFSNELNNCEKVSTLERGMDPEIANDVFFQEKSICYYQQAKVSGKLEDCEHIEDDWVHTACIEKIAVKKKNYYICEQMKAVGNKTTATLKESRTNCLLGYATDLSDTEACKAIEKLGGSVSSCLNAVKFKK